MKTTLFLLALAGTALSSLAEPRDYYCDSDNCARAVTGTRKGPEAVSTHRADCVSYMQVTVDSDGE
jgi:hypothetical protein